MLTLIDGDRLTPQEAGEYIGAAVSTLYYAHEKGHLTGEMILGRLMFTRAALDTWAASRGKARARDTETGRFTKGGQ